MYPLFLKLEDVKCLVIGGGVIAERKTLSLIESGAEVTLISPDITNKLDELIKKNIVKYCNRLFRAGDTHGFFLVIAATNLIEVNKLIYEESITTNTLINCVDEPEHCNFYVPAQIKRGDLQIAISTSGKLPMLAGRFRKLFETILPKSIGKEIERLHQIRTRIITESKDDPGLKKKKFETELEPEIEIIINNIGIK
ncbi:MAG: bifunctional precorrin-2 dehydrogenase/sirohydrochlorin ferrochelatase [Spirochaetia bacterium]|jgi:precorrin-2 dehydrogenase/sirohydrochlorin ferrochelatase|nr:bifunctional precorrin-2 dehydrogenase/sirohydrochlorin ferrochelatase [Spirochaetia bacterium]